MSIPLEQSIELASTCNSPKDVEKAYVQNPLTPMDGDAFYEAIKSFDDYKLFIAGPDFKQTLGGPQGLLNVVKIEYDSKLIDCDNPTCDEGKEHHDVPTRGFVQRFEDTLCPKCGGSGKRSMPMVILVPESKG